MKREHIKVEQRDILGKKVKKLRRDQGLLPANIYGKDMKSTAVQLPISAFKELYKKVRETGLVDIELGDTTYPVLIYNVQFEPKSREPLHADFFKVNLKEKITANVPVVATDEAPAVIDKKGVLLQTSPEVEIEALPTDLPEKLEVSLATLLEVGDQITVEVLKAPQGVTILTDPTQIIFKIDELVSKEAEEQAAADEAAAAEAATEGETAEGEEKPASDEAPKTEAPQENKEAKTE